MLVEVCSICPCLYELLRILHWYYCQMASPFLLFTNCEVAYFSVMKARSSHSSLHATDLFIRYTVSVFEVSFS